MPQILKVQKFPTSSSEQTYSFGGAPMVFRLNTDSVIYRLWIVVKMVVSTGAGTETADGIKAVFSNIQLRGTLAGEAYNPIPGISSASLIDLMQLINRQITLLPSITGTGFIQFAIPVDMRQPSFSGLLQYSTCIPAYLTGGDLTLILTPAAAATDIGSTFAVSSATVKVVQEQFESASIPLGQDGRSLIPFLRPELADQLYLANTDYGTARSTFRLPAGGLYAHLLIRSYASNTAKQSLTTAPASSAPFDYSAGKGILLYDLNRRVKQEVDPATLYNSYNAGIVDSPVQGNYPFTFAWDGTNGLFATDRIGAGESNVILEADTRSTSGTSFRIARYRIYDPANVLNVV